MAVLQAVLLDLFPRDLVIGGGVRTATHRHFLLVRYEQPLPKAIQVGYLVVVEHRLWAACERVQGLAGGSRLDPLVAAKDLGPGLLDDQHPDFLWPLGCIGPGRLRKRPSLRLVIVGEVVVDHDSALLPIDVHLHSVAARFVHFICQENALNAIRLLGQGAQTCQKVAVSASTLLDVIGPWIGIKHEVSLTVDLSRPLPGETFPALVARLFSHVTVEE